MLYQDNNYDLDEVIGNEKSELNNELNHEPKTKNELETTSKTATTLPNGFYLVNQKQQQQQQKTTNNLNSKLANKSRTNTDRFQNSLNKRKPLNAYISTPGYNVDSDIVNIQPARNHKCESVFSVRSRAAYSEAYFDHHRQNKQHKYCSHRRKEHHKHNSSNGCRRQSSCSHRHKDQHHSAKYEDECLSADEFEDIVVKNHHSHRNRNRSRSYHALCDENDHKYFNEFDNELNYCTRNRHNKSHRSRRHRSCCLNELRYDSGQEDDDLYIDNNQDLNDETNSLCSSIHSLNKSIHSCKRKHRQRKELDSKLSLKMNQVEQEQKNEKIDEQIEQQQPKSIIKRSFKNLKLIDQLDCDDLIENQESEASELSYCSHHSRKSRRSKVCHRSKSKCCKHSRSNCNNSKQHNNHSHYTDSYANHYSIDYNAHPHERRSLSRRPRRKNLSCESLSEDQEIDQITSEQKLDNEDNQDKFYRSNNIQSNSYQGQYIQQQTEINKFNQPIERKNTSKTQNNQYLLAVQQFSNDQYAYELANQTSQDYRMIIPKYNTINYKAKSINEQIQNNFIATQNYLPNYNYNTMANNLMKPMHFQANSNKHQIGLPFHQSPMNFQSSKNNLINQNGMYLTNNGLSNNSSINTAHKNEQFIDLNQNKHQVYQNLKDYLKESKIPRYKSSVFFIYL